VTCLRTQMPDEPGACVAESLREPQAGVWVADDQPQGVAPEPALTDGDLDDAVHRVHVDVHRTVRVATPTRLKKRLGTFLREVRKRADRTMDEAADHLKAQRPTVSRYETGEVLPVWSTVHMLLSYYAATEDDLAQAARLYDDAKDEPRSVRLTAGASKAFRKLVNAEREAVRERELAPFVIPGLLQTKRYAWALIEAGRALHDPEMRLDGAVATRMERQKPLDSPDPMLLHAVIDEAAIRREIGGPEVLREQLDHLLALVERPNITLQVVPYTAGAFGTMMDHSSSSTIPSPTPSLACTSNTRPAAPGWTMKLTYNASPPRSTRPQQKRCPRSTPPA
jgi:transcriptional regulator with XRE-family HTH domain